VKLGTNGKASSFKSFFDVNLLADVYFKYRLEAEEDSSLKPASLVKIKDLMR
jgi:hypothetical protein